MKAPLLTVRPISAVLAALTAVTVLAACGAPPGARSGNDAEGTVRLERTYAEGDRYQVLLMVDTAIPAANRLIRTEINAELHVTGVSETGTATLALVVEGAKLHLPLHPVAIGPAEQELNDVRALYRVDKRGRLRGDADVEGSEGQQQALAASIGAFLWARPSFPREAIAEGDTWDGPVDWGWVGEQLGDNERELSYVFEGVTDGELGETAAITIEGRAETEAVEVGPGSSIRASFRLEGDSMISLGDGISGHGSARARATFDTTGEAERMVASLPSQWAVEWCIAPVGTDLADIGCGSGELLAPRAPNPEAPAATLYTGDACEGRVTEMREALSQVPDNPSPPAPEFELPVVAEGTEPFAAEGPALEIEGDEIRVDGRVLSVEDTVEALNNLREQWARLRPGGEAPDFLYVMVHGDTSVANAGPALAALAAADWNIRLVVSTGEEVTEAEPSHPAPEWLSSQTSRLETASPSEKAMAMAALMGVAIGGCGQALQAFSALNSADFETRAELIREHLPSAVEACHCQALDIDALEVLLLEAGGSSGIGLRWIALPLGADGAGQRLRLGRNPNMSRLTEVLARRSDHEAPVRLP